MQLVVRLGVVACVALACLVAAGRLDDAVAVFDFQADANARATHTERSYPEVEWLVGGERVIEDSRLWMPKDATYQVVHGPGWAHRVGSLRFFLRVLLYPREPTDARAAPWAFCLGCTPGTLGPGWQILSDSGRGFLFARKT